ncbi:hypothetical protein MF672_036505 [Actinomadura sp. ATCC 31491]|uniref:Amidohydrolase family protein n=1 Tax=Actinomadura luzonensis TaxID=2805427 RepID=A0ABT0G4B7_9ACTN|nr:hypothetical protein [Actinomadura luzonensis]MCK2219258.1 hypothetical protein [Actinomadura luzonensis]
MLPVDLPATLRDALLAPLVDHHCHGVRRDDLTRARFELLISEGGAPAPPGTTHFDTPYGLALRRWCAPLLDLEPHAPPAVYLARRTDLGATEVNRRLLAAAGVVAFLVDTGPEDLDLLSAAEMGRHGGAAADELVRIEQIEQDVAETSALAVDYLDTLAEELAARAARAVGLKTVIATRCGLDFDPARPSRGSVIAAANRRLAAPKEPLTDPVLLRHLLWSAVDVARERGLPLQFHTGFPTSTAPTPRPAVRDEYATGSGAGPGGSRASRPAGPTSGLGAEIGLGGGFDAFLPGPTRLNGFPVGEGHTVGPGSRADAEPGMAGPRWDAEPGTSAPGRDAAPDAPTGDPAGRSGHSSGSGSGRGSEEAGSERRGVRERGGESESSGGIGSGGIESGSAGAANGSGSGSAGAANGSGSGSAGAANGSAGAGSRGTGPASGGAGPASGGAGPASGGAGIVSGGAGIVSGSARTGSGSGGTGSGIAGAGNGGSGAGSGSGGVGSGGRGAGVSASELLRNGLSTPPEPPAPHRTDPARLSAFITALQPLGLPLILLGCYPFHREAAYLAAVHPHVYVDVGLALPHSAAAAARVMEDLLELAPFHKQLFSSGSRGLAESCLLGALYYRRALGAALAARVRDGEWSVADAARIAHMIGSGNARRIYRL